MLNFKKFLMQYFMTMSFVVPEEGGGDFVIDETPETNPTEDASNVQVQDTAPTDDVTTPETNPTEDASNVQVQDTAPTEITEQEEAAMASFLEKMGFKGTMDEMRSFMEDAANEKNTAAAVAVLQEKYQDYSSSEVLDYLNVLAETDRPRAEALNNPIGWENVYLRMRIDSGDGVFLAPRGVSKEPFDVAKASAKAENGDEAAQIALLYNN